MSSFWLSVCDYAFYFSRGIEFTVVLTSSVWSSDGWGWGLCKLPDGGLAMGNLGLALVGRVMCGKSLILLLIEWGCAPGLFGWWQSQVLQALNARAKATSTGLMPACASSCCWRASVPEAGHCRPSRRRPSKHSEQVWPVSTRVTAPFPRFCCTGLLCLQVCVSF